MLEDYKSALRAGQRAYRARIARGQSPYLAVLDDVLKGVDIVAQEPLGLVEITRKRTRKTVAEQMKALEKVSEK